MTGSCRDHRFSGQRSALAKAILRGYDVAHYCATISGLALLKTVCATARRCAKGARGNRCGNRSLTNMTKRRKKKFIERSTKAELMPELALYKLTKQLESAHGKWVWIKLDKMTRQLVPAEPIRAELEAQLKAKKQMLEFLRTGKVVQP
jgi:hypothetical protein